MSVAPAVLLDGTCVVPLKLKDSGGNIVWQISALGAVGVGGADLSSGTYAFRSVSATSGRRAIAVECSLSSSAPSVSMVGDTGNLILQHLNSANPSGGSIFGQQNVGEVYDTGAGGLFLCAINAAGTLNFVTGGTSVTTHRRWQITAAGHLLAFTDNAYDIGASGATRPRDVYVARNVSIGGTLSGQIAATGDLIVNDATRGLVLKSANGHYWRLTVDNAGSFLTADLGTSLPT